MDCGCFVDGARWIATWRLDRFMSSIIGTDSVKLDASYSLFEGKRMNWPDARNFRPNEHYLGTHQVIHKLRKRTQTLIRPQVAEDNTRT